MNIFILIVGAFLGGLIYTLEKEKDYGKILLGGFIVWVGFGLVVYWVTDNHSLLNMFPYFATGHVTVLFLFYWIENKNMITCSTVITVNKEEYNMDTKNIDIAIEGIASTLSEMYPPIKIEILTSKSNKEISFIYYIKIHRRNLKEIRKTLKSNGLIMTVIK